MPCIVETAQKLYLPVKTPSVGFLTRIGANATHRPGHNLGVLERQRKRGYARAPPSWLMNNLLDSPLRRPFVLLLVATITVLFLVMIRSFIFPLLFAALIAGLLSGIFVKLCRKVKGQRAVASALLVAGFLIVVLLPLVALTGMVIAEALRVTTVIKGWLTESINQPGGLGAEIPSWVPFAHELRIYGQQTAAKVGQFAGAIGSFLVENFSKLTQFTMAVGLDLFVFTYALYYFFVNGPSVLTKTLSYIPLAERDKQRILAKGLSVTRATIKGTFVIGFLQGLLGGASFAVVGLPGALFWGVVMAVFSIIPAIGTGLVWVPAAGFLLLKGQIGAAIGLTLWCALVVGSVDNILRPMLVGKDTKMPDLLILVSTLGGLALFGATGIILGPLVAALFMIAWEIYGVAYQDEIDPSAIVIDKQ
jgi:predicted PurR-regulated permease PerM